MRDIQVQYEEAAAEFEMAHEDGAAMYWWTEMNRISDTLDQARHEVPAVASDVMMEMIGD